MSAESSGCSGEGEMSGAVNRITDGSDGAWWNAGKKVVRKWFAPI